MGGEALFVIGAGLGGVMLLYLVYQSWQASARAYALPTLPLSIAAGLWSAHGMPFHSFHYLIGFLIGAVIFCLHARAIKLLLERG